MDVSAISAKSDITKTVPSSRERTRSRIRFVYPLSTIPPPFMSRILYIIRDMIAIGPIPLILSVPIKNLIYTSKIKNFARQYSFHICHIFYILFVTSGSWQVDPVVHQAHAGFILPGNQTVGTFPIDRAFVLDLHAIGFIKAVFQIGDDTAQGLQSLPLS